MEQAREMKKNTGGKRSEKLEAMMRKIFSMMKNKRVRETDREKFQP